jgi:hypothetical protein
MVTLQLMSRGFEEKPDSDLAGIISGGRRASLYRALTLMDR